MKFTFKPSLREFDLGGVLYHANYFHLYEKTREAFLEKSGIPYPKLVEEGFHLALTESHQEFLAPIYYGQEIEAVLSVCNLQKTNLIFHYKIFDGSALLHKAWTKQVFVEKIKESFKPKRFPTTLLDALKTL